jgi:hypothetical protein
MLAETAHAFCETNFGIGQIFCWLKLPRYGV